MTNPNSPQSLSADQLQTWLDAYQENQRQIVRAHDAYQAALQEGLQTFMETMAHTQAQLAGVMQRLGLDADVTTPSTHPTAPKPITAPRTPRPITPSIKPSTPQQTLSSSALEAELLKTVADKTGYPQEMLEMDMALEEDLGIDSIKRVEILSALRDKHPELPEVDGNAMANIHTLNDVITHLRSTQSVAPTRPQTQPQAPTPAQTKPSNGRGAAVSAQDLEDVLLDTVAQKTGYPKEMLELDMTLEEDLGIDSIKRVEILSALRDRAPHLPEVNADHMVQLRTLGDIVQFMRETSSVGASANFF